MTILAIVDTVLLVVALVYIVALLRSHADILRRLAAVEDGAPRAGSRAPVSGPPIGDDDLEAPVPISGMTLAGDSVALSFDAGSPPTLLAFLSSGCTSCAPFWAGLRDAPDVAERVVVVTHGPERESPARVARLAPADAEIVMSTDAWQQYAIPASPHFILTDGRGGIRGRGAALDWSQLETMVGDARAEADGARPVPAPAATSTEARTTEERAARSAQALARAGIGPGHPSLFPSLASEETPAQER